MRLIEGTNLRGSKDDYDETLDHTDHREIQKLLVGRTIEKVADDHLLLDDGTLLKLFGNDGGCSCSAGDYDLTDLNGAPNRITAVWFQESPDGDDLGSYRIFVLADNQRINLATFEGSDGSGYYGTGYHILIRNSPKENTK